MHFMYGEVNGNTCQARTLIVCKLVSWECAEIFTKLYWCVEIKEKRSQKIHELLSDELLFKNIFPTAASGISFTAHYSYHYHLQKILTFERWGFVRKKPILSMATKIQWKFYKECALLMIFSRLISIYLWFFTCYNVSQFHFLRSDLQQSRWYIPLKFFQIMWDLTWTILFQQMIM